MIATSAQAWWLGVIAQGRGTSDAANQPFPNHEMQSALSDVRLYAWSFIDHHGIEQLTTSGYVILAEWRKHNAVEHARLPR